jgi:hypothetical protein
MTSSYVSARTAHRTPDSQKGELLPGFLAADESARDGPGRRPAPSILISRTRGTYGHPSHPAITCLGDADATDPLVSWCRQGNRRQIRIEGARVSVVLTRDRPLGPAPEARGHELAETAKRGN